MEKYTSLKDFDLGWQFLDPSIPIPKKDLEMIKPLSKEFSKNKWTEFIDPKYESLFFIKGNFPLNSRDLIINDWNDNQELKRKMKLLSEKLDLDPIQPILFFWNAKRSVETKWGIFLKYAINFIFAGSEAFIILFENDSRCVLCVKGMIASFHIVDRQAYFGQK